jgi:hypothetical protein
METSTYTLEQRDENTVLVWGPNADGRITSVMTLWFDGTNWNRVHGYGMWSTLQDAADAAIAHWDGLMARLAR